MLYFNQDKREPAMIQSLPPKFFDCCIHFDMAQAPRCVSLHSGLGYERGDMCNAIANVSDDAVFKFAQMEVNGSEPPWTLV